MMKMHNPPHPGEVLKELCLKPKGLSVTEVARALGVSRKTLSAILNGRAGISPEMAVRLSIAFDTTAESWLNQQVQYDLAGLLIESLESERDEGLDEAWAAEIARRLADLDSGVQGVPWETVRARLLGRLRES